MVDTVTSASGQVPNDTGFERTLASQAEAAIGSSNRPNSGLQPLTEEDFNNDVSVVDSIGAAFEDSGVIVGGIRAAANQEAFGPPDPNYDIEADLKARPDDLKFVQKYLDKPTDPSSGALISRLADSRNAAQTAHIIKEARAAEERARVAGANGFLPQLAGTLSGMGIDIVAGLGLSALTGGAGDLPLIAARTETSARALAAGRLALLGAGGAAAEREVQSIDNPLVSNTDILEAAGFGAGMGGVFGFAFPTLVGRAAKLSEDMTNPMVLTEGDIAAHRPAGAAVSPGAEERTMEPAQGSGSLLAKGLPKAIQEKVLRNPKRVLADIGMKAAKDFAEKGRQGGRKFFDTMSRAVRLSTVMKDEVGGAAARAASVQDIRDQFRAVRLAREEVVADTYNRMTKDVFNAGGLKRAIRNTALLNIDNGLISQAQFEAMADELAIARADQEITGGADIAPALDLWPSIIPNEIARRLTPEQTATLKKYLIEAADGEDGYYEAFGNLEVQHGLISEDELIPGYRPQRWNREAIEADPQGFQQFLLEAFSKQPDENWIRQSYQIQKEDGTFEPLLKQGETFFDLNKRDPASANRILDDWGAAIKQHGEEKAFVIREAREKELKKVRGKVVLNVNARITDRLEKAKNLYAKLETRAAKETDPAVKARLADRLTKIEKRINDEGLKLTTLSTQTRTAEALDAFLLRFGNAAQKKALKKATKRVEIAARREARATAKKVIAEQIDGIRKAILDGDSPFGFVDQDFIQSSSRFKRRAIRLGIDRFRPEARRFLLTSTHDARAAYDSSVGTQVALRQVFGPIFEKEGEKFSLEGLRSRALSGYDDDLRKNLPDKERRRIVKERDRAKSIFDHIFAEITHSDITSLRGVTRNVADLVSVANTATAAMALGGVVLSQLGDLAVQIMAGGRLATGFRFLWRRGVVRHMREIAKDDTEMAVLLQGPSVVDASRFRALADIDNAGFDIPGSKFRNVLRKTDEVAKIEGWANFMHVWNLIIRGGFGLDFARQIDADLAGYARLPAHLKTFYAKLGIDANDARDMADLMNRAHRRAVNGKLRIPLSSRWAAERPDLLMKYKIAVKTAGDEAMIEPNVADRPFLRSYPGGRLILQFQSFMFSAGERFIAPLIQELHLHPTSIRPYVAALAGIFLGAMTDGIKAAVRGQFDQWADNWNSEDGFKDNLWGAVMRSPLMAGPSSMLTDVGMTAFGRVLNDRIDDLTGLRPLRQDPTRFREDQGLFALAGPVAGTLLGTLPAIARRYIEGDVDEATAITARRLPIANLFYLHILSQLAGN